MCSAGSVWSRLNESDWLPLQVSKRICLNRYIIQPGFKIQPGQLSCATENGHCVEFYSSTTCYRTLPLALARQIAPGSIWVPNRAVETQIAPLLPFSRCVKDGILTRGFIIDSAGRIEPSLNTLFVGLSQGPLVRGHLLHQDKRAIE